MSSIDKRIVQMQFDNQGFERGVSTTMKSLDKLNESLKMKGTSEGLNGVNSGLKNLASIGLSGITSGVDTVTARFSALGVMGATALMNITNSAINAGKTLVRSLTIEPVTAGFSEYETKMNAIQTILTNTASKGTTMEDVTATLNELNKYADQTIYNFAEMTRNIGTFTAAGIDLETSATAIKGIANLAAGSGSNAQQASTAMYQLSQALAAGKVSLMDWNSVVNAGMGGELFQNALKKTAKEMGIFVDTSKPFRETLQDGWLTADVLTKTLTKFAEDESLLKAATEVKTFTQLLDTMKESVQSGWATSWEYIIGDKEQAASFFTSISDGFNKMIQPSTDARNAMLKFWNEHGGRTAVIEGLTNVMESLQKVMRGISMAWEMVFPPMTGQRLVDLSKKFKDLTEKFKITDQTAGKIGRVFKGLFDAMLLVKDGVAAVISGFSPMVEVFKKIFTSIFDGVASFGGAISDIRKYINDVGLFNIVSSQLQKATSYVADFVLKVGGYIASLASKIKGLNFSSFIGGIGKIFGKVSDIVIGFFDRFDGVMGQLNFQGLMQAFHTIAKAKSLVIIAEAVRNMLSNKGESSGGLFEGIKNLIDSYADIGEKIGEVLGTVKESLETFQQGIQVDMLFKIAAAIAILAASLLLIASIEPDNLKVGLAGMAGLFLELTIAFAALNKIGFDGSLFKVSALLITFSVAILLLSAALKSVSSIPTDQMASGLLGISLMILLLKASLNSMMHQVQYMKKVSTAIVIFAVGLLVLVEVVDRLGSIDTDKMINGLLGLGLLLAEIAAFMFLAKFGSVGVSSAAGILILSAALLVLEKAVDGFGGMDTDKMIQGLIGIAAILTEIALFSKFGGGGLNLIGVGTGLVIIGAGITILANALETFSNMKWEEMARGLTAMAGGLVLLGAASTLMSGAKLAVVGVGVAIMSASLLLLSSALKSMGSMTWEEIGKGLLVLAGALTILGVAMYAMSGALLGAAAMVVIAGALAILTPQLLLLSNMSLEGVGIALLALAGAFTVLGLAGLLLTPVIPTLLALSGVIVLLGLGAVACGVGLGLIGAGIGAIAVAVAGSGLAIVEFLKQLLNLLPLLGTKLGEMLINMAKALGDGLAEITKAIETVLMALLTAVQNVLPKVVEVAVDIVEALAEGLARGVPAVVRAAMELVLGVLQGIADNIQGIVEAGADCVIGFMDGLANKLPEVIESGINLALSFIEGVADGLTNNQERMSEAVRQVIKALLTTGVEVITGGVTGFLEGGKELLQGLVDGIEENWPKVKEAAGEAIEWAKKGLANIGTKLLQAGKDLIQGFINGIGSMAWSVISKATEVVGGAVEAVKNFLGINSPSRVFMEIGKYTAQGMSVGLDKYAYLAEDSASGLAKNVVKNVKNPLSNIAKLMDGDIDINPTITPVMDLSNVEQGARRLSDMIGNQDVRINARTGMLAGSVGTIQNGKDNSDVISAIKDLKEGLNNNTSYTINGITYDDGSNITNAVETLVRAARIERRI